MRTVLPQLAPPTALSDPFPAQWLRSIQSAGHPVFDSLLGGTWRDIYISESWKMSSDGVIRQGGHSIEIGIRVGKSIKPLYQLPVMVQWCWPKVSIRILGKSTPDRVIRVIPALCTDRDAATAVAIEIGAKESGIAFRTRGMYASSAAGPALSGWSVIPTSPVAQRIVFSRTKPSNRISQQLAHASSCVKCLDDSDIPSWLTAAMTPALQFSASRPPWVDALLGFSGSRTDATGAAMQECQKVLASGAVGAITDFFNTLDSRHPKLQPELTLVLKWLIANHPASKLDTPVVGTQLVQSSVGNSPFVRALAYAVTRTALPSSEAASVITTDIREGRLQVDPGQASALFASSGDLDLASGAAFLAQPSMERQHNQLTPSEWLALLYANPAGLRISGCLAIDRSAPTPFGVRSPLLSPTLAGTLTSRKEIEANRIRISVASGTLSLHSVRTWRTGTSAASALAIHIGKSGSSTTLNTNVEVNDSTRITFPKAQRIGPGESLVISTVGTS